MKKEETTFYCDEENCSKEITTRRGSGFPYDLGWRYLYNIAFKYGTNKRKEERDKHFCCKTCMIAFIRKLIPNFERGKKK